MSRHVKIKLGDELVDGEELEFEPLKESWNEYRCEDGSYAKLKVVVSRIIRLEKLNPQGEPIYQFISTNVVAATPPPAR
jgi:hypothetical protein